MCFNQLSVGTRINPAAQDQWDQWHQWHQCDQWVGPVAPVGPVGPVGPVAPVGPANQLIGGTVSSDFLACDEDEDEFDDSVESLVS